MFLKVMANFRIIIDIRTLSGQVRTAAWHPEQPDLLALAGDDTLVSVLRYCNLFLTEFRIIVQDTLLFL
jgi:hypothetical protein